MKKFFVLSIIITAVLAAQAFLFAEEQKPGQPLLFPKDQVKDRPSDLHMGSDPYYHLEKHKYEGSDETGYPREYDPYIEYKQSTIKYKKVDKKKKIETTDEDSN